MKHKITAISALRVTAYEFDPFKKKDIPMTKICHKASVAAEHYALTRNAHWWRVHDGQTVTFYSSWLARYDKLNRRVLKVFQKYLP